MMYKNSLRTSDDVDDVLERYSDMVYKIAFSHTGSKSDADDVFQNVFLRYINCKKSFEGEEHRKAYLIKSTVNQSRKLFSSAWFRKTEPISDDIIFETQEDSEIYYAVLELPLKYRTVIHLYYYEDLNVAQISKALDMKESTIKSQLHRARNLLKVKLKGEYEYV